MSTVVLILLLLLLFFLTTVCHQESFKAVNSPYTEDDIISPALTGILKARETLQKRILQLYPDKLVVSGLTDYNIRLPFKYSRKQIGRNVVESLNLNSQFPKLYLDSNYSKIYTDDYGTYQLYTQLIDFDTFFNIPVAVTIKITENKMNLLHLEALTESPVTSWTAYNFNQ